MAVLLPDRVDLIAVEVPLYRGPAIHVCRYPVAAPRQLPAFMVVPFPKRDASLPGALGAEVLLLPEGYAGHRWPLLPADMDGICPLWGEDPKSPLLVPLSIIEERRVEREWRARVFVTPSSVGVTASSETIAHVAWAVLCRADPNALALGLARLSCLVDRFRWEPEFGKRLVHLMDPPPSIRGRLLAVARGGQPLLHPRGVQWVLREMAVVADEEREERAEWRPRGLDDSSLLARAWFRCLRQGKPPDQDEVMLAVWMLHESYHGSSRDGDGPDEAMSMTTALAYRFETPGSWMHTLDRWMAIWTVDDSHPAVANAALRPSELREMYEVRAGMDVVSWLAGVWAVCMRWWLDLEGCYPSTTVPDDMFSLPLDTGRIELSDTFRAAFDEHVVGTVDDLRTEALMEIDDVYEGLGSLPQSDSRACRNYPVIKMPDGSITPLSVELVAERAVVLHRFLFGPRTKATGACGHMFEAYVTDVMARLKRRHVVVSEAQITSVLGESTRCDGLIADGGEYVAVEAGVQSLSRRVARGNVDAIRSMAVRYQDKADQAVATIRRLPELSAALGIPLVTTAAPLVVTETMVPHSPVFQRTLRELRPDRTPKLVCSIGDFEMLVDLGLRGWSVPRAIANWQAKAEEVPLDVQLDDMARTYAPVRTPQLDIGVWIALLPSRTQLVA